MKKSIKIILLFVFIISIFFVSGLLKEINALETTDEITIVVSHTITFNANGGSGTMSTQTIAEGTTDGLNANTFTYSGYSFSGWATSSTGSVVYTDKASYTMGTSDVTLYAKWTQNTYIDLTTTSTVTPTTAVLGIPTTFSTTITNQGTATTGASFPYLLQKRENESDDYVYDLATTTTTALAASTSRSVSLTYTFDSIDNYELRICADKSSSSSSGSITESNETNNCGSWTSINIVAPNLTVSTVTPTTATVNVAQTYSTTVSNDGDYLTSDGFNYFVQTATGTNGSGTITNKTASYTTELSAGATRTLSVSHTFTSAGTPSMRFCVDKDSQSDEGDIAESDEDDNCGNWTNIDVFREMSGALTPHTSSTCTIATTGNSCTTSLDWSIVNPTGDTTAITSSGIYRELDVATNLGDKEQSGTESFADLPYGSHTFYLYNNGEPPLANTTTTVTCDTTNGYEWNTDISSCVKGSNTVYGVVDGIGGTISPASRDVTYNQTTTFTVTPYSSSGYVIDSVSGCDGSLSGNTYTTGKITDSCTVTAKFRKMTGDLTPNSPSCTISLGDSSCSLSLGWSITDPIGDTTAITSSGMTDRTVMASNSDTKSGTESFTISKGSQTFYLYNNAISLDEVTAIASCGDDSTWNGSICAVSAGTLSVEDCTILQDYSSCFIDLTWSTTRPVATSAVTTSYPKANTILAEGNSGIETYEMDCSDFDSLEDCARTFYLYNNEEKLDMDTSEASCEMESRWDSDERKCVYQPPILSLVTPGCLIGLNSNECTSNITWDTDYPARDIESILSVGSTTLATGDSNTEAGYSDGYPYSITGVTTKTFKLTNHNTSVESAATSRCVDNTHWSSTKCVIDAPDETTTFTAAPTKILKGGSSKLTWDSSTVSDICVLTSDNEEETQTLSSTSVTGTLIVTPEISTTYTLKCSNDSGEVEKSIDVNVIDMTMKEI